MNNMEFYNAYVENILSELTDLVKQRVMMKTQIDQLNAIVSAQAEKIRELEASSLDKPEPPEEDTRESF